MKVKKAYYFLLFLLLIISDCKSSKFKKYSESSFAMGTFLDIILFSDDPKKAKELLKNSFKLADDLEKKFSSYLDKSIISKLNKSRKMDIDDELVYELIKQSVNYARITNGAFDPSLYHLVKLWGFDDEKGNVPSDQDINVMIKKTGFTNITLKNKTIELTNEIALDLGGIAKGMIIGEVAEYLENNGIKHFLVNGGGDIIIRGLYNNERKWKIAIADPFESNGFMGFIQLSDCSIVTSGDYEKNFIDDEGKLYHHILDPKTGYPVDNGIHSVTVITKDPSKADALATALFVMGKDEGVKFANSIKDVEAIFVTGDKDNKQIYATDSITYNRKDDGKYDFMYISKSDK